jgi:hypothetical protein
VIFTLKQSYKNVETMESTNEKDCMVRCGINEIEVYECNRILVKLQVYSECQLQDYLGREGI